MTEREVLPPYDGDAEAQFEFAEQYYEGYGVSQERRAKGWAIHQAVKWWEMAAERGFGPAQNRLGWAYSNGQGVPKDFVKAHMWLTLAWERNKTQQSVHYPSSSDDQMAYIEPLMTSAQIAEARKLARDWIERHTPKEQEGARAQTEVTRGMAVIERRETMVRQTKSSRTSAGYIYILKPRISIDGQEIVKMGMTTRTVAERVRELTTGSMVSFEVVYSLHVENARSFEKYLHARYRTRRLIAGGGQEFFSVPAQEVVAEIERRATEISRARAQAARNGEMAVFLNQLGAARVESSISGRLGWLWFACWLVGIFGVNRVAHSILGDSAVWWITVLAALIVLPVILSIAYKRLKRHFMALYYEPRFRSAINAKDQELRVKYPLAYR